MDCTTTLKGAAIQLRLAIDGHIADILPLGPASVAPTLYASERLEALFAVCNLLTGVEHKLLTVVAWRDGDGKGFYGSGATISALAARTGCGERSLKRAGGELVAKGLVVRERQRGVWRLSATFASASAEFTRRQGCHFGTPRGAKMAPLKQPKVESVKRTAGASTSTTNGAHTEGGVSGGLSDANWHRTLNTFFLEHEGSGEYCRWARSNLKRRSHNTLLAGWRTWQQRRLA